MPFNDDTLNITPVLPVGATPLVPDFMSGDGVLNPGGDKNPQAAAHARAKIAATDHRPHPTNPLQTTVAPVVPGAIPASPAQRQHQATRPRMVLKEKTPGKLKPIINAVLTFVVIVLVFKAPVLISQLQYLTAKTDTPVASGLPTATDSAAVVGANPLVIIPKINVNAPLIFESNVDDPSIEKALENGVVHYGTSALPGSRGNVVVVGHSSNDWWQPGNYKYAFVLLEKLSPGDQIMVNYQSKQYKYEVIESKVVEATDVSVLAPTTEPTLTLITCWPVGTNFKREIIRAKQTSPKIDGSTTPVQTASAPQHVVLPGSSPSWGQQISDFWNSIGNAFSHKATEVKPDNQLPGTN